MKKSLLSIFAAAFAFALPAFGQQPTPQPAPVKVELDSDGVPLALPIGSYGQLKGYALERVFSGNLSVSALTYQSTPGSYNGTFGLRNNGESPDQFVRRVMRQEFRFGLLDVRDTLYVSSYILDKDGDILFNGYTTTGIYELGNGAKGFSLQGFELHLSQMIALPAGKVTNAMIYYRDEYGNFRHSVTLEVRNGKIYFPTKYAGREGQVLLRYPDQNGWYQERGFNLAGKGERLAITPIAGIVEGAIDNSFETDIVSPGQQVFVDGKPAPQNTPPVVRIRVRDSVGQNPVLVLVHSRLMNYFGSEVGVPDKASVRKEGDPLTSTTTVPINGAGTVGLMLAPGVYYLHLDNNKLFNQYQPEPDPILDNPFDNGRG